MFLKFCFIFFIGISMVSISPVISTNYHGPSAQGNSADGDSAAAANYQFQYAVNEGNGNGNDFGHEEERNGKITKGIYRVLLPDGRMQVVSYVADENGYRAEVTYESGSVRGGGYSAPVSHPPPQQPSGAYIPPKTTKPQRQETYGQSESNLSPQVNRRSPGSGSFVKLRSSIGGQSHNYDFNL